MSHLNAPRPRKSAAAHSSSPPVYSRPARKSKAKPSRCMRFPCQIPHRKHLQSVSNALNGHFRASSELLSSRRERRAIAALYRGRPLHADANWPAQRGRRRHRHEALRAHRRAGPLEGHRDAFGLPLQLLLWALAEQLGLEVRRAGRHGLPALRLAPGDGNAGPRG